MSLLCLVIIIVVVVVVVVIIVIIIISVRYRMRRNCSELSRRRSIHMRCQYTSRYVDIEQKIFSWFQRWFSCCCCCWLRCGHHKTDDELMQSSLWQRAGRWRPRACQSRINNRHVGDVTATPQLWDKRFLAAGSTCIGLWGRRRQGPFPRATRQSSPWLRGVAAILIICVFYEQHLQRFTTASCNMQLSLAGDSTLCQLAVATALGLHCSAISATSLLICLNECDCAWLFDTLFGANALFYWFSALVCFRQCIKVVNLYMLCASNDIQSKGPTLASCRLFRIKRHKWHEKRRHTSTPVFGAHFRMVCDRFKESGSVSRIALKWVAIVAFSSLSFTRFPFDCDFAFLNEKNVPNRRQESSRLLCYYILTSTHTHTHTHTEQWAPVTSSRFIPLLHR